MSAIGQVVSFEGIRTFLWGESILALSAINFTPQNIIKSLSLSMAFLLKK